MSNPIRVVCAIILRQGRVLCAQRSEDMSLPLKWEFPGGKIEPGESPEKCLKREIKEELNIEIELGEKLASNLHTYNGNKMIELIPFVAGFSGGNLQLNEHKSVIWQKVKDLKALDWASADIPVLENFTRWYFENH
ncbi:(deoxy)nucleoside triphosphate pyrophosphohydrolase [Cecembia sp.]|uniref:(deoxy)nucleoside triphosphate pyrophosphohydrolase n=1 Tax=Cecembia sp. TaxID=1898110 RepID=UPI0025B7D6D2|nr:(deoxy)nucleoside triphosphate pyrophosphohydrolase [Cecembia sp.]